MIRFNSILVEGFGAYSEPFSFSFNSLGINLIRGKNGAGKTTVFSALSWCLYGTALKLVNVKELVTWPEKRQGKWNGTRVIVFLEVKGAHYAIARHIDYKGQTYGVSAKSSLLVFKRLQDAEFTREDMIEAGLYKGDIQGYIDALLSMNIRVFLNSVVFGQRLTRLVQASNDDKRKLLEEVFPFDFIDEASLKTKNRIIDADKDLVSKASDIQVSKGKIENYNLLITENTKALETFEIQRQAKRSEYLGKIEMLTTESTALEARLVRLKESESVCQIEIAKRLEFVQKEKAAKKVEIDALNAEIETIRELARKTELSSVKAESALHKVNLEISAAERAIKTKPKSCPTCGKDYDLFDYNSFVQTQTELIESLRLDGIEHGKELNSYRSIVAEKLMLIDDKKYTIKQVEGRKSDYEDTINGLENDLRLVEKELLSTNSDISRTRKEIAFYERSLESLENESPVEDKREAYKTEITKLEGVISVLETEVEALKEQLERLKWIDKKCYSNSGLKAFIFNSILTKLNDSLEIYASRFGFRIEMRIDLEKASKPFVVDVVKSGINVKYESLSGGEQQRVDICIAFALHDLVSVVNQTNLLVLDEVFEGIDDGGGIEEVFDLIRFKAGNDKNVFVITHSSSINCLNSRIIEF